MTLLTIEIFDRFRAKVLQKLREQKESKEWSAVQLAESSGLSVQSIYSLAGGQRGKEPEFSTIFKLAQAMGWTMDDIAAELFPDRAGAVYRLIRERPKVLDHLGVILGKGTDSDLAKIEADLAYMAEKLTP
jgi:transcriptional regulator with XRE-family HTH domain